jgi:hypothetical protein
MRRLGWFGAVALVGCLAWGGRVWAQGATMMVALPAPLLPQSVAGVDRTGDSVTGEDPAQADAAAADVLRENGLQRFSRAQYGRSQVEALQFHDATGAYSAFTFYQKNGAKLLKPGDRNAQQVAVVGDRTVFLVQTVVLIGEKGADLEMLSDIAFILPKIGGPRSQPPLLPTFFPRKGLVPSSILYAQGPMGYAAMGGTLTPAQLGWEKSAEAATAEYSDRRGKETLTLLLYPTPQIAGEHERAIAATMDHGAKARREGELVIVASGSFSRDDAQNMIENIHVRSEVSFDKPMPLEFHAEVQKTYSLLMSIAILSGFGMLAAVLLGLFFGGGRAIVRKMQGKDAATDAEFLSLHLDNQNKAPRFDPPAS